MWAPRSPSGGDVRVMSEDNERNDASPKTGGFFVSLSLSNCERREGGGSRRGVVLREGGGGGGTPATTAAGGGACGG